MIKSGKFKTGEAECMPLGSKIEIPEIVFTTGGGATNTAVTFARQKLSASCISRIGKDPGGQAILDDLKKENISAEFMQTDEKLHTAYSIILIAKNGERTILVHRGAAEALNEKEINWKNLKTRWFYLSSLSGNIKLLQKVIAQAKRTDAKIVFNPGSKEIKLGLQVLKPFLKNIDVLILNQEEASFLTKIPFEDGEKIFKKLIEEVPATVIMNKGTEGVLVFDRKIMYRAGIPKSETKDRTGAGDAFGSAFVSILAKESRSDKREETIKKAIQLATANATSVIQHFGAKEGILKKGKWGKWAKVPVKTNKNL